MASTNTSIPLVYAIWIAFLLFFGSVQLCLCFSGNSSGSGGCIERERKALLSIRKGIYDAHRWLSWNGKDCCRWRGVRCDTVTGHVVKLDLHYPYPCDYLLYPERCPDESEVSPSLLHLRHLNHLDLSMNNFSGAPIPDFIGSLAKLEYLDLSNAGFGGTIPHQLGNLSNLLHLDLASNDRYSSDVDNLGWLPSIRFLQHLDMSNVNLSKASNWIHAINMLPSLSVLRLSGATLSSLPSTLPHVNFTSLTILDLSGNYFASSIPGWLFNLSSLERLDLWFNNFYGNIPIAIGNLKKLQVLDLSWNNFSGDIPETVWSLKSLQSIDLSGNNIHGNGISGQIPETVGNLKNLVSLDLSSNSISGRIPETVGNLKSLETLDLSSNNISGRIPETVGNLKSLESLDLSTNNISGEIPKTIGRLTKLQNLWLYDNQISGEIPETIGNLGELSSLDLSRNRINGQMPSAVGNLCNLSNLIAFDNNIGGDIAGFMEGFSRCNTNRLRNVSLQQNNLSGPLPNQIGELQSLGYLDLSSNLLDGSIPASLWKLSTLYHLNLAGNSLAGALTEAHFASLTRLSYSYISYDTLSRGLIDLSNNSFSGPIPPIFGGGFDDLGFLLLAHNRFNGSIPSAFCEPNSLEVLNLADNDLSGVVPNCWNNSSLLEVIDFSDNKLSGDIPSSMGSLSQLISLHLRDNNFSGKIPLSLQQCKQLTTIDLGNNKLSGRIPEWIGGSLLSLRVLRLRSNMLDGNIPQQLSLLASLQVLDLADNKLSGTLPPSFGNFKAMITTQNGSEPVLSEDMASYYTENIQLTTKDLQLTFTSVLSLVTSLDLSDNNISGEIPEEFTNLRGLSSLNLSGNHLTGRIPRNIGAMGQLESLDLSMNNLSSTIPTSIADLNFLELLNLSHNNLSGRIPSGNQLQTLNDPSIYIGNQYLCGQPLPEKCPGDEPAEGPTEEKQDENGSDMIWFYVGLSPGFVVGFWGFLGVMMLKKSTRYAYIRFIDRICDWIYMAVIINYARPKSKKNRGCKGGK